MPSAEAAAQLFGQKAAWEQGKSRYALLSVAFPQLVGSWVIIRRCNEVLAGYSATDFERLARLLKWSADNPRSALYLRRLPVLDVDAKWVEKRTGAVGDLVRQILGVPQTASFHDACGLCAEPSRLRIRLCPDLRKQVGGLCDIEAPATQLAALPIRPQICQVGENLNTGIALPDMAGTVTFMRLGLAVDQLEPIGWLRDALRQVYWGDLDTHGFVALARARRRFPHISSALMDEVALLAHESMWVREDRPSRVEVPEGLTEEAQRVYEGLRTNRWGELVRLEQERIAWPTALSALRSAIQ